MDAFGWFLHIFVIDDLEFVEEKQGGIIDRELLLKNTRLSRIDDDYN